MGAYRLEVLWSFSSTEIQKIQPRGILFKVLHRKHGSETELSKSFSFYRAGQYVLFFKSTESSQTVHTQLSPQLVVGKRQCTDQNLHE